MADAAEAKADAGDCEPETSSGEDDKADDEEEESASPLPPRND